MSCDENDALRHKVETLERLLEHERADVEEARDVWQEWSERCNEARALVRECYPWVKAGSQHGASNAPLLLKLEALPWLREE